MKRKLMILAVTMVMMVLPMSVSAQGLFNCQHHAQAQAQQETNGFGMLGKANGGSTRYQNTPVLNGASNQPFGIDPQAPLGSGVVMLIAAGAGYAVLKSKQAKKN